MLRRILRFSSSSATSEPRELPMRLSDGSLFVEVSPTSEKLLYAFFANLSLVVLPMA